MPDTVQGLFDIGESGNDRPEQHRHADPGDEPCPRLFQERMDEPDDVSRHSRLKGELLGYLPFEHLVEAEALGDADSESDHRHQGQE
jgi:hypothetical protein